MIVKQKKENIGLLAHSVGLISKRDLFKSKTMPGVLVIISSRDTGKVIHLNCFDLDDNKKKKSFLSEALINRGVLRTDKYSHYIVSSAQVDEIRKGALCAGEYIVSVAGPDPDKTLYENISANILHELSRDSFNNVRQYMIENNHKWSFSYN